MNTSSRDLNAGGNTTRHSSFEQRKKSNRLKESQWRLTSTTRSALRHRAENRKTPADILVVSKIFPFFRLASVLQVHLIRQCSARGWRTHSTLGFLMARSTQPKRRRPQSGPLAGTAMHTSGFTS